MSLSGSTTPGTLSPSTQPVTASTLPLPTGASTETTLSTLNTKVPALGQALAAASTPVVLTAAQLSTLTPLTTVAVTGPLTDTQLRATPVPISGTVATGGLTDTQLRLTAVPVSGTVTANAGTGTFAVSGPLTDTQLRLTPVPISGTVTTGGLTDTQLRATALPVSGTVSVNALPTGTNIIGSVKVTDGTNTAAVLAAAPASDTGQSALAVRIISQLGAGAGGSGGGSSLADKATFTEGTTTFTVAGGVFNETITADPTEDQGAAARITAKRGLHVNLRTNAGVEVAPLTDTQLRATPVPVSGTVAVTGPLTDTQLRATAVPVSGTVSANATLTAETTKVIGTVNIAAGQTIAATGPLTDTQLRATAVPVSLTSTTITGSVAVTGPLTDAQLRATAVPVSGLNPTGTATTKAITGIDTGNTTTANLAGGATFTGAWKDAANYSNLTLLVFASHVSATDGLVIEYSTDGVTVHDNDVHTVPAANGQQYSFPLAGRFFRVRYVNGATLTTTLQIQSKLHDSRPKPSSMRLSNALDTESDAELVKAVRQQDIGRNARHFMLDVFTAAPAVEAVQSVVQWYNNAAVAGTTQPAVVPAGKTLRLQSWTISTKSLATVGSAVVRIRVNTAGLGVLASPLVFSFEAGSRAGATTVAMTGGTDTLTGVFPEGFEIPAGAGLSFSMAGYGPAGVLALQGVTRFQVHGYEY